MIEGTLPLTTEGKAEPGAGRIEPVVAEEQLEPPPDGAVDDTPSAEDEAKAVAEGDADLLAE